MSGQIVEWAGPAGQRHAPVAEVDIAEVQFPDGLGAGGVDGGQGEGQAAGRSDGRGGGLVDVVGGEGLDEVQGPLADADAAGGVPEYPAGLLAVAEQ